MPKTSLSYVPQPDAGIEFPEVWAARASVMVIDDDPTVLEMVSDFLRDEGFRVCTALNGLEALAKLRSDRPDLILLDLMMPVADGWQFLEQLRVHPLGATIPVVLLSAVRLLNEQASRLRVDGFLPKPFDITELLDEVNRLATPC